MTQPTQRPPGGLDVAARVALVLVLLALAAHGLSSRRDLDWSALDSTPQSPWVGVLLAGLAGAVVVVATRTVIRSVRQAASAVPDDAELPDIEGRPLPWWFWLGAGLLVLAVLVGVYELVLHTVVQPPPLPDPGKIVNDPTDGSHQPPPVSRISLLALALGAAAALLYFGAQVRSARRAARPVELDETVDEPEAADVLAGAVEVAGDELTRYDDERTAIVAAYAAMERHLAAVGATRRASDTPTDFLLRAVATARVSRGAATTLTDLFREARFSTHPMPAGSRDAAARALARVATDLTDVRA